MNTTLLTTSLSNISNEFLKFLLSGVDEHSDKYTVYLGNALHLINFMTENIFYMSKDIWEMYKLMRPHIIRAISYNFAASSYRLNSLKSEAKTEVLNSDAYKQTFATSVSITEKEFASREEILKIAADSDFKNRDGGLCLGPDLP